MAEGGVPSKEEMSTYADNFQEQSDELEAMCSIFEADPDRIQIMSRATTDECHEDMTRNMLKVFIPIDVNEGKLHVDVFLPTEGEPMLNGVNPDGAKVSLARSESGQRVIWGFDTTHLPPLCLHVTLPHTYPSQDPPSFILMCSWLSPKQLSAICRELDRLWYENKTPDEPGMPILYTWVDWVQESCLSYLGVQDHLSVTVHQIDDDVDDCRIAIEMDDLNQLVTSIVRYNQEQEIRNFFRQDQDCEICFDRFPGDKFYLLLECNHHFCKDCMRAHCELLVKEGTVQNLKCASYKCKCSIPPYILKDVLTEEQFKRYDALALQKALDVMEDLTYCPRCNNAVIREPEQDLNLGHCLACFYSFCTECEEAWHQGEECKFIMEERKEKKASIDKDAEGREMHRLKTLHKDENRQSKKYIKSMTKQCPKCKSPIMKVSGCNYVHCSSCHAGMCWSCGVAIHSYSHFANSIECNTFQSFNEMIDNADMRLVNLMAHPVPLPPPEPQRRHNEGHVIEERLKIHPDLTKNILRCVTCKQKNEKKNENNHLRCWNCSSHLCFMCKQKVVGAIGKHFHGVNSCSQHLTLEYTVGNGREKE